MNQLVKRLDPEQIDQFVFEKISDSNGEDIFTLSTRSGKVIVGGNNAVSAAFGLNWYLKYYCKSNISWCGKQISLPEALPEIEDKVVKTTSLRYNTYFNYCTFCYSMAFWDWRRWEKEIDLLALNGINTPLAVAGTEVIWRNTLRRLGYSDPEIKEYLSGSGFLAWLYMGNLEKLGGPLPNNWFDQQEKLQKKIVQRMREYDMQPIFHGFCGLVPTSLKEKFPEADIIPQGMWGGGTLERPHVLSPTDPLFSKVAKIWYEEQEKLFGRANYFGGDLFHEGGKYGDLNLAETAQAVQQAMLDVNKDATWVIQAWGNNPLDELLAGLDKNHTIIVDLCAEYWEKWKERKGFNGFPWIWSNVTSWGGNINLHGRLDAINHGPFNGLNDKHASKSIVGIGSLPENIETNPVVYDFVNELRWHDGPVDVEQWISDYSIRRYGKEFPVLKEAWKTFYHTAYGTYSTHRRPSESVFCARPSLKREEITASRFGQCKIFYDPNEFAKGVELLLSKSDELKYIEPYKYDVTDIVRQFISNLGRDTYYKMVDAWNNKDKKAFKKRSDEFLSLLLAQDKLLASHPMFNVGTWIAGAESAGVTEEEKDQHVYNAKLQISTWNDIPSFLVDYANKEWAGILKDLYYPRWKSYIEYLAYKLDGKDIQEPNFFQMETSWAQSPERYEFVTGELEHPVDMAKEVFSKYYCQDYDLD
uniref:alpha-N-acetylglucosaminidase n=1 Tax=uncultured Draconibacterium sp. TaxID=1573823 RepID=UPI003217C623